MKNRTIGIILIFSVIAYIFKDDIKKLFSKNNADNPKNKPVDKTLPYKDIENIKLIQGTAGCYECNVWGDCKQNGYYIEIYPINDRLKLESIISNNINFDEYTQTVNSMIYYTKDVNLVLESVSKIKEIGGVVKNSNGKYNYYNC